MTLFESKAPGIMMLLMKDFDLDVDGAAAILGNLGLESGGFKYFQELKPKSGRGGIGWPQWTGVRRRSYEAYCTRNKLDPTSDKANYAYLWVELSGDYKSSITAVKKAVTLYDKVVAFEKSFERAGVKNYPERYHYAQLAKEAYTEVVQTPPSPQPIPVLPDPQSKPTEVPLKTQSWFITFLKIIFLGHK